MPPPSIEYPIFIYPAFVHFTALVRKFIHTCLSRLLSKTTKQSGKESSILNLTAGFIIFGNTVVYNSPETFARLNRSHLRSITPDSILDRSRISLINRNNNSLFDWIIPAYSSFSSGSSQVVNSSEKPTIAFKGVRISWLILARKADLSRSESSAFSFISFSSWIIFSHFVLLIVMPV